MPLLCQDSKGHVIPLLMMSRTKKKNPFSSGSSQNSVQTGSSSSTARTASSSSSSAASRQPKTKRRAVTIHVTGTSVVSHDDPSQSKTADGALNKGSTLRGTVDGLFKTLTPLPYLKSLRSTHSAESSAAVDPPVEHLDHIFRRAYAANNLTDPFPDIYYRNPIIHAYNKVRCVAPRREAVRVARKDSTFVWFWCICRGRRNDTVADDEILLQGVESGSVDMYVIQTRRTCRPRAS